MTRRVGSGIGDRGRCRKFGPQPPTGHLRCRTRCERCRPSMRRRRAWRRRHAGMAGGDRGRRPRRCSWGRARDRGRRQAQRVRAAVDRSGVRNGSGGWVELLFDDLAEDRKRAEAGAEQMRVQRTSRAQYIQNVLDDLKAVHDRVEQARLLIQAYRSAATFRDEMRGLVDARVRLLNVERALRTEQGARLTTAEADVSRYRGRTPGVSLLWSRSARWTASTNRTVPLADRMTTEWVSTLSP